MEATKTAMERMREKAISAGLKGVHWNLVAWGNPILPVEKAPGNTSELIDQLGFDSSTSYVWIHHVPLPETTTDYNYVRDEYFKHWGKAKTEAEALKQVKQVASGSSLDMKRKRVIELDVDPKRVVVEELPDGIQYYVKKEKKDGKGRTKKKQLRERS